MSLLIATPCYGGQLTEPYFRSCMQLKEDLTKLGIEHDWLTGRNESLIHRGRMKMTRTFLESNHSHMMWWDADIEGSSQDVANLWNMQVDIAVGVYPMKKPGESWYAAWVNGALVKDLDQYKEPIEVDFAGTGFMMISRLAISRVLAYLKARRERYENIVKHLNSADKAFMAEFTPWETFDDDEDNIPALYMTPIFNGGLESEDYNFCRVARQAGLKVMMDPSVRLKHWGMFPFKGETSAHA